MATLDIINENIQMALIDLEESNKARILAFEKWSALWKAKNFEEANLAASEYEKISNNFDQQLKEFSKELARGEEEMAFNEISAKMKTSLNFR